uniref:Serpin domain-containing protein n=1 Tax=Panagrolaimus superbus TaxID=310955 RepID=A0A914Y2N3_9BILA
MSQCIGQCQWESNNLNSTMANSQADFTMNLLRINGINSSTILSPISIFIALAMAYLGAKENTAAEIRNTIAKGIFEEEIHPYFSSFLNYSKSYENIRLKSVNRIYFQNNLKIQQRYFDEMKKYYNNEFEQIDFRQPSDAAKKINKFVAKSTNDRFLNFMSPSAINSNTSMISINAIYFKADWENIFWATFEADFYSSPKKITKVQMMSQDTRLYLEYFETDEYEIIGLPYKEREATMYIILPKERFGLQKVMNGMDLSELQKSLAAQQHWTNVNVKLPQFQIKSSFNLVKTLQTLGIKDAFNENANFSGISKEEKIKLSNIVHKTFIKIDENGCEAAAFTGVLFHWTSGIHPPPKSFTVDHPFLFIIADKKFNFLFAGTFFG